MQIKKWHMGLAATGAALMLVGHFGAKSVHSRAIRENRHWISIAAEFGGKQYEKRELERERVIARSLGVPLHEESVGKFTNPAENCAREYAGGELEGGLLLKAAMDAMKTAPIRGMESRTWFDFYRSNVNLINVDTLAEGPVAIADGNLSMRIFQKSLGRYSGMPSNERIVRVASAMLHESAHNYVMRTGLVGEMHATRSIRRALAKTAQLFGLKLDNGMEYFCMLPERIASERAANYFSMRFLEDLKKAGSSVDIGPVLLLNDNEPASCVRADSEFKRHVYSYLAKAAGIALEISTAIMVVAANIAKKIEEGKLAAAEAAANLKRRKRRKKS